MSNDEKKARYEAAAQKLLEYKSSGKFQPSNEYLDEWYDCNNVWWEAIDWLADWQAKRKNSPDIRAGNVMSIEDHACNTGDCDHYIQKDCDKTLAAYCDAQASDSSAEFPEAEFAEFAEPHSKLKIPPIPLDEMLALELEAGARWGFERGRASQQAEIERLKAELADWEKSNRGIGF